MQSKNYQIFSAFENIFENILSNDYYHNLKSVDIQAYVLHKRFVQKFKIKYIDIGNILIVLHAFMEM